MSPLLLCRPPLGTPEFLPGQLIVIDATLVHVVYFWCVDASMYCAFGRNISLYLSLSSCQIVNSVCWSHALVTITNGNDTIRFVTHVQCIISTFCPQ